MKHPSTHPDTLSSFLETDNSGMANYVLYVTRAIYYYDDKRR